MSITISIENSPAPVPQVTVPWTAGMNVQQALEAAYDQVEQTKPGGFRFGLEFYGTLQDPPLGYMLVMVDGVSDEPDQGTFWELLVNDQPAAEGIDSTILDDGDHVTLRNEVYVEETHQGTRLGRKRDTHAARRR
jgi:Domain of unknown function (DUF4430)